MWTAILIQMGRWRIKPSSVVVLCCVLLIILLVQVLAQVDLLDTAFQRGTAPVLVHARATGAFALREFPTSFAFGLSFSVIAERNPLSEWLPKASGNFPVLHHVIRC